MMDLKNIYTIAKLSEVPVDWKIKRLKDIVIKVIDNRGKTPPNSKINSSYPLIEIFNFSKNKLNISLQEKQKYVDQDIYLSWFRNGHPSSKSILISTVGNVGLIGITNIKNICIAQNIVGIDIDSENHFKFVANYMKLKSFQNKIVEITMSAVQPSIKVPQLLNLTVVLPPLEEQKKIARILSTMDEQIEQTDQLIEKTKELKKGLMQQLLSKGIGQKALKHTELGEIPVDWEIKEIGEIFYTIVNMSLSRNQTVKNGDAYYLHYGDIHKNELSLFDTKRDMNWLPMINENEVNIKENAELFTGDVVFADASEDLKDIGKNVVVVNEGNSKFYAGLHTITIRELEEKIKLDTLFKGYCFKNEQIKKQIKRLTNGTTVFGISKPNLLSIKFAVPPFLEQQKIASILSSVDEDIEGYEEEKVKYEELKKGLMQQLLTGKMRVKVD